MTVTMSASMGSARSFLSLVTGFSKWSETEAMPAGFLEEEPLKMTSSIAPPRRDLALCSPSTHLMASTTFDLPQPLGPTIPTMGSENLISVLSAKDLKPLSVSFASRMGSVDLLSNTQPAPLGWLRTQNNHISNLAYGEIQYLVIWCIVYDIDLILYCAINYHPKWV